MYETLLSEAHKEHIEIIEFPFWGRVKGLYLDRVIGVNPDLTTTEKACVLAEELGHYHTTYGDILDQDDLRNRKQENRARRWGYEKMVPLDKLIAAFEAGVQNRYELTEFLNVTVEFLLDVLKYYREKHGLQYRLGIYVVCFEPLMVFKEIEKQPIAHIGVVKRLSD